MPALKTETAATDLAQRAPLAHSRPAPPTRAACLARPSPRSRRPDLSHQPRARLAPWCGASAPAYSPAGEARGPCSARRACARAPHRVARMCLPTASSPSTRAQARRVHAEESPAHAIEHLHPCTEAPLSHHLHRPRCRVIVLRCVRHRRIALPEFASAFAVGLGVVLPPRRRRLSQR